MPKRTASNPVVAVKIATGFSHGGFGRSLIFYCREKHNYSVWYKTDNWYNELSKKSPEGYDYLCMPEDNSINDVIDGVMPTVLYVCGHVWLKKDDYLAGKKPITDPDDDDFRIAGKWMLEEFGRMECP